MKKFGYPTKSTEDIRNLVGKGAGALIGRSIWGQAKKEFGKVQDEKIKKQMVNDFISLLLRIRFDKTINYLILNIFLGNLDKKSRLINIYCHQIYFKNGFQ